jgi:hypothetical protein
MYNIIIYIEMLSEATILALSAGGFAFLTLIARLIYSSKCKVVQCGCCRVERDTNQEASLRNLQTNAQQV